MIPIPNWVPGEDENSISNIGDTGYFNEPYFEMGSGIEYVAPIGGGTSYTGVPWGDADNNLGRVYPDPNEVLRPVEKRQFPMNIPAGPFGDARDVNPEISVEFDRDQQAIQSDDLYGGSDYTTGDPDFGKQLDAFNDYNMYNTRQPGLEDPYMAPTQPRPRWDNAIGNTLRSLFGYNRGGIMSLKR